MNRSLLASLLLCLVFATACGPSPEAIATQTASAQTAIAAAWTKTPTPTSTFTPTPTLTATPSLTPLPTATPTPEALLFEDFTSALSCFNSYNVGGISGRKYADTYRLDVEDRNLVAQVLCEGKEFGDFTLEAEITPLVDEPGNHYQFGLLFRHVEGVGGYYFLIDQGAALCFSFSNQAKDKLLPLDVSIEKGGPSEGGAPRAYLSCNPTGGMSGSSGVKPYYFVPSIALRVTAIGDRIELYQDDKLLATVQDSTLTAGQIGLVVSSGKLGGASVKFDNIRVTAP